jgi:O-acetyl-ADP-ribose deacetylase (regulator of RNase III)
MRRYLDGRVSIVHGDITRQQVDAIVNAANPALLGGGGVDGAIHRAGGPAILAGCQELRRNSHRNGLAVGDAVVTTGGKLPARFVIHTVGPVFGQHGGDEPRLLASCYRRSLELAAAHELASIAFPAIGTGAFGYPKDAAARVASAALAEGLAELPTLIDVRLVFFAPDDAEVFVRNARFEP